MQQRAHIHITAPSISTIKKWVSTPKKGSQHLDFGSQHLHKQVLRPKQLSLNTCGVALLYVK